MEMGSLGLLGIWRHRGCVVSWGNEVHGAPKPPHGSLFLNANVSLVFKVLHTSHREASGTIVHLLGTDVRD